MNTLILISGTNLTTDKLPFAEVVNYAIEPNEKFLKIKLKTVAINPVCLGVYLHKDLEGKFTISPEVEAKLHYFTSDEQLSTLLENGGKEEPEPEPEPEEQESIDFGDNTHIEPEAFQDLPNTQINVQPQEETTSSTGGFTLIKTVDIQEDPQDFLLEIPNISEDTDSYKQQLENKERIIAQKDAQLLEVKKSLDDLYKLQDIQLAEIKEVYTKQIDEANTALAEAKKKLEEVAIPEDLHGFLKYSSYAQNYKAFLQEGYTKEDLQKLGKLTSKIHIFAMGSGDSTYTFLREFCAFIEKQPNVLIVDFLNDQYINSRFRIATKDSSMHLKDNTINIQDLVKDLNGTQVIPTTYYNDIALLTLDWVDIIKRLNAYAKGRPIIFLFNSINSFATRYSVSKLSTLGDTSIFAKCNPIILSALFGDMAFIPANRFKVVALEYIDVVHGILERMANKHKIIAYEKGIKWKELLNQ